MARITAALLLGCGAALIASADEAEWQADLASAMRLARQTDRPIFAVLH